MKMKEASIFDPNAHIEAVAIRYDEGSETWQLQSIGTLEECQASCDRTRSKGCEEQMRVYRVGVEKDAARYRWLRQQNILEFIEILGLKPEFIDETVDALMSRENENPNGD